MKQCLTLKLIVPGKKSAISRRIEKVLRRSKLVLVLKATNGDLSILLEATDIYAHTRAFASRHATIIKVWRVSVASLNHAAPRMIDAPRAAYLRYISAYFHWSRAARGLNATGTARAAFLPPPIITAIPIAALDTRHAAKSGPRVHRHYNTPRLLLRSFIFSRRIIRARSDPHRAGRLDTSCAPDLCHFLRIERGCYEIFYYTTPRAIRLSRNRDRHRRLSAYVLEISLPSSRPCMRSVRMSILQGRPAWHSNELPIRIDSRIMTVRAP